jgi:hypothetical protein
MIEPVFRDGPVLYSDFAQINAGRWEAVSHHPSSPPWVLTRTTKGWRLRGDGTSMLFPGRNGLERAMRQAWHTEQQRQEVKP